ncbi:MAG: pilus assembly protein TadG-related protein, partial [Candidatus Limnocylindrales bacterium]
MARPLTKAPLVRLLRRTSRMPEPSRARQRRSGEHGQVLVVFAIGITGLLAAAGVAIDIGRFYSEHRFLQNAADAAALAAAHSLVRGGTDSEAVTAAQQTLTRNFQGDPNGRVAALPPATPVYESGHAGDPAYLRNGILISGGDVRVAVVNDIDYTFGRVVGLNNQPISARARVKLQGDLLPIAARRFINTPGPNAGATYPCSPNPSEFTDFFSTAATSCLGSEADASLRVSPSAGSVFDALDPDSDAISHGPLLEILGQGAQPNNGADFRGFVALDIRNFQSAGSQLYYNGVTASTNANTLKSMEAGWIATGYKGPMFPSVIYPPDPNDQVAIMSGNATGISITAMTNRYAPGDEIMVLVYPGNVMAIPDFTLAPPAELALPTSGLTANAGILKVGRNQAFSGQVTLSTLADLLDAQNPMTTGAMSATPITYNPNPVTPSLGSGASVALQNVTTSGALAGIYTIWVQGQAGSPYLTTKVQPMALKIGSVGKDFTFTSNASNVDVAPGATASLDLVLQNSPTRNTNFGNPVTLSVDVPRPAGVGPIAFSSTNVSPSKLGAHSTLTIDTGTMAPGLYTFTLRATGTNTDSPAHKVTHLFQVTLNVGGTGSGGAQEYVDI